MAELRLGDPKEDYFLMDFLDRHQKYWKMFRILDTAVVLLENEKKRRKKVLLEM